MMRFVSNRITIGRLARQAMFVLGMLAMAGAASAQCMVTQNGAGNNDGASWANAMELQTALDSTSGCSEVWVKAGTYKPTSGTNRNISFNILPGVEVYGGFAGGETQRSARDPGANPTILSGDIGTSGDSSDNSYHVVWMNGTTTAGTITTSTVLDGFTISGGNADGSPFPANAGGGLYCKGSNSSQECSPSFSNLTFSDNSASGSGGAMYNNGYNGTSNPTLNNVTFSGNNASGSGGAMFNYGRNDGISSPTLSNVTFSGNSADDRGGAMINYGEEGGTSSPTLSNVTFSGNSADNGGAMYNHGQGGTSSPTLSNVTFSGNSADFGGAMYNHGIIGTSSPSLSNVIAWGNTATTGPEIHNDEATPSIDHSVIEGSGGSSSWDTNLGNDGGNNLDADPDLGPLADNGGFTLTMLPGAGSSAIDAGDNASCPNTDQRGVARPQGTLCDIGAVEVMATSQAAPTPIPTLDWRLLLLLVGLLGGFALLHLRRA